MPNPFIQKSDFKNHYEIEATKYDTARIGTRDGAWVTAVEVDFLWKNLQLEIGKKVLEAGCGTGRILLPLAKKGLRCFGIDPARNMLSVLLTKSANKALKSYICISDAEDIPFADDTFDGVYTLNLLQWLPGSYEKSFAEMYRVANKNARIIMDFPNRYSFWRCLKAPLSLIVPSLRVCNKTFRLSELRKSLDRLCKGQYVIKSRFSYPQKIHRYSFGRYLGPLLENKLRLPFQLRGKFYVIVTKQ